MEYKQVIILRKDLNMRKGKMCAQAAHASLKVFLDLLVPSDGGTNGRSQYELEGISEAMQEWLYGLQTKVCVGVPSEQALQDAYTRAEAAGLPCSIITDAGKTEFGGVPTKTAVAIGPGPVEEIDKITGTLTLL